MKATAISNYDYFFLEVYLIYEINSYDKLRTIRVNLHDKNMMLVIFLRPKRQFSSLENFKSHSQGGEKGSDDEAIVMVRNFLWRS